MAALSGKVGLVEYKGVPVLRIQSWTANVNTDLRDVTSFSTGTLQWREFITGLSGASGSFDGFWDAQGSTAQDDCVEAALAGSTGSLVLTLDKEGGDSLTCGTYFSGLTAGSAVDGDATVTFDFTVNGAVVYSTAT